MSNASELVRAVNEIEQQYHDMCIAEGSHIDRDKLVIYISQYAFHLSAGDRDFFHHYVQNSMEETFNGFKFYRVNAGSEWIVHLCRRPK